MLYPKLLLSMCSPKDGVRFAFAVVSAAIVASLEAFALLSIVAFLSLVTRTGNSVNSSLTGTFLQNRGLLFTSIIVLLAVVLKNGYSLFNEWYQNSFVAFFRHRLSVGLLRAFLSRSYLFFLEQNTDQLGARFLTDVDRISEGYLRALLLILTECMVLIALLTVLFAQRPQATLFLMLAVIALGAALLLSLKRISKSVSFSFTKYQHQRYLSGGATMRGIKDIKAACTEASFLKRFSDASFAFSRVQVAQGMLLVSPRLLIETTGFAALVGAVWYIQQSAGDLTGHLPIIAMYATAAYRMLPSTNRLFSSLQQLRLADEPMLAISAMMQKADESDQDEGEGGPILMKQDFGMAGLHFRYPGQSVEALRDVSFTVRRNEFVGIVGPSGAGKSTLVDVLLGLLAPSSGSLMVDGRQIAPTELRAWRRRIGYVPQSIFLLDGTIGDNIVFGRDEIVDQASMREAARLARMDDFIATLDHGYETAVGENGVRLSGGQRQRIGIARALYRGADVLLFDEATSALDYQTERLVTDSIQGLSGTVSIIVVAHRLSTVAGADRLLLLDGGRLVDEGTYDFLANSNALFKRMIRAATA